MNAEAIAALQADYAKQLWALSNAICAFSIVQALSFGYALQSESFEKKVCAARAWVAIGIVGSSAAYGIAIFWIDRLQVQIIKTLDVTLEHVIVCISHLKIEAVTLVGLICLFLSFFAAGHTRDKGHCSLRN